MKKFNLVLFAALGLLFTACEKNEGPAEGGKAKYAVILYANGGENLDQGMELNISEALGSLYDKKYDGQVRMAVCMKYSSENGLQSQKKLVQSQYNGKKYIPGGKAGEVYFYELQPACYQFENDTAHNVQYLRLPDSWIVDHSSAKMYEPAYISDVLQKVAKSIPAENYIMVLNGHGAGWRVNMDGDYPAANKAPAAAITDEFYFGRAIKAKELAAGIRQSGVNVTAVVFDCCLQNSIEYLAELTDVPTLKYTLASGHITHGTDYGEMIKTLYEVPATQAGLKQAMGEFAAEFAYNHSKDWEAQKSPYCQNTDFAVCDLSQLPEALTGLKSIVDYMIANPKDSALYAVPSRSCYHYFNGDCKYDLIDYLTLMLADGAPYEGDAEYEKRLETLTDAMKKTVVHHAYSLHFVDEKITKEKIQAILSMSINLGAKGKLQTDFSLEDTDPGFECRDETGALWYFNPNATAGQPVWHQSADPYTDAKYAWQYSYSESAFEKATGWTRWLRQNPVMPYDNPPHGDDNDRKR